MNCRCRNCDYIMPDNTDHRKQRGRTAPNRTLSARRKNRQMQREIDELIKQVELLTVWCGRMQKKLNEMDGIEEITNG